MGTTNLTLRKRPNLNSTKGILIFLFVGLLFFGIFVGVHFRRSPTSTDPQQLLVEADRLAWLSNWKRADDLYSKAEHLAIDKRDKRNQLYARCGRLRSNMELESLTQASEELANILGDPIAISDSRLRIRCLATRGDIDRDDHADSSYHAWQEVLKLAQGLDDKSWQARANAEMAIIDFMGGNAAKASDLLTSALTSSLARMDVPTVVLYGSQVGNGLVEMGRADEALEYCNTVLHMTALIKDAGFPVPAYVCKARAFGLLGKPAQARKLLAEALDKTRQMHMPIDQSEILIAFGQVAVGAGDRQKAIQYFEEAAALSRASGLNHSIAWSMYEEARVYRDEGDYANADRCETEAMNAMRRVGDEYHLPLHLAILADLKSKEGEIEKAHELYNQAAGVTEALLVKSANEEEKRGLIARMSEVYKGDFTLSANLGRTAEAFKVIETARGRSIADAMRQPEVRDTDLSDKQKAAEADLNRVQRALLETDDRGARSELLDQMFLDEQFMGARTQAANSMQEATLRSEPVELAKLQAVLLPDEALLEYVLTEPVSFCLAIDRKQALIVALPAGEREIEKVSAKYLGQIEAGKRDDVDARKLYDVLLASIPKLSQITRLTIVPDGVVWNLPIGALRDTDDKYVLESHTVSYVPSSTVLYHLRTFRRPIEPEMAFLGIGSVPYDLEPTGSGAARAVMRAVSRGLYDISGAHLYALPETGQELNAVSQALGQPKQSTLLIGDNATETDFKSQPLSDFKIIHFAVHAVAVPDFPDRDALILGRDPHSNDDGLLQVREIERLTLNADLVTLSACNTGTGKIEGEEGSTGLVQAFLFAGARTVAASLWPVDDISTELLMKQFYVHLAEKQDVASALRNAEFDYIKSKGDKSPSFWGAFIAVGDASKPINFQP